MRAICGVDCCDRCEMKGKTCDGCTETNGHPCGGICVAAELINNDGFDAFIAEKIKVIEEINSLGISDLRISDINLLKGDYINLEYTLPNGNHIKLLEDSKVYWANQVERPDNERCYGLAADEKYILVCEYGCNGKDPEIVVFRKR